MTISSLALIKRKRRQRARKHNIKQDYFTKDVDKAIKRFLKSKNDDKKNEIFEKEIKKAFTCLVNNLIYVYKVADLDTTTSLRDDCVRYLYQKIETYDYRRASKAFSYFNVVARNWLFQRFNTSKKEEKKFMTIDDNQVLNCLVLKSKEDYDNTDKDFFDKTFITFLIDNMSEFKKSCKDREQLVIESILYLLNNPESIDIFNKKAVYIYVKNMTGINTKQIALALGKIRSIYFDLKEQWISQEENV